MQCPSAHFNGGIQHLCANECKNVLGHVLLSQHKFKDGRRWVARVSLTLRRESKKRVLIPKKRTLLLHEHQLHVHAKVLLKLRHPRIEDALGQVHHRVQLQRGAAVVLGLEPHELDVLDGRGGARGEVGPERVGAEIGPPPSVQGHRLVPALLLVVAQAVCAQLVQGVLAGRFAQEFGVLRLEPVLAEVLDLVLLHIPRALPDLALLDHEEHRAHAVAVPHRPEAEIENGRGIAQAHVVAERDRDDGVVGSAVARALAQQREGVGFGGDLEVGHRGGQGVGGGSFIDFLKLHYRS
jgi:hypothetical protein